MHPYDNDGYYIHPDFPTNKVHHTAIIGDNVQLGKNNVIMPFAVIGQPGFIRESDNPKGFIKIGDKNVIGCYVNIMSGAEGCTYIGNDNLIMNHSNIGHNIAIADGCEIGAGTILNGHCVIRSKVKIKSGCVIRNRISIIEETIIGQGSNVIKSIGTPGTYYGNPAILIKRKYYLKVKQ